MTHSKNTHNFLNYIKDDGNNFTLKEINASHAELCAL